MVFDDTCFGLEPVLIKGGGYDLFEGCKKDEGPLLQGIYGILCDENGRFYIGSTKNISTRKYQHKSHCKQTNSSHYNRKVYQTIRANGGWQNWNFVVIEEIKECSKIQALIREEYHRQEIKANLNAQTCFSGITDYVIRGVSDVGTAINTAQSKLDVLYSK